MFQDRDLGARKQKEGACNAFGFYFKSIQSKTNTIFKKKKSLVEFQIVLFSLKLFPLWLQVAFYHSNSAEGVLPDSVATLAP